MAICMRNHNVCDVPLLCQFLANSTSHTNNTAYNCGNIYADVCVCLHAKHTKTFSALDIHDVDLNFNSLYLTKKKKFVCLSLDSIYAAGSKSTRGALFRFQPMRSASIRARIRPNETRDK